MCHNSANITPWANFSVVWLIHVGFHYTHFTIVDNCYTEYKEQWSVCVRQMTHMKISSRWMGETHTHKIIFLTNILLNRCKIKPTRKLDYCKYFRISEEMRPSTAAGSVNALSNWTCFIVKVAMMHSSCTALLGTVLMFGIAVQIHQTAVFPKVENVCVVACNLQIRLQQGTLFKNAIAHQCILFKHSALSTAAPHTLLKR